MEVENRKCTTNSRLFIIRLIIGLITRLLIVRLLIIRLPVFRHPIQPLEFGEHVDLLIRYHRFVALFRLL